MNSEQKGVTLIETLLYLALFGIIFISVMTFVLTIAENNRNAESKVSVQRALIFIQEHISVEMDSAESIDSINSVFGVDNGVLVMNLSGGTATYQISNGRLTYSSGGQTNPVSVNKVVVTQFYIDQVLDRADQLTGVRVTLTLESEKGETSDSMITSFLL